MRVAILAALLPAAVHAGQLCKAKTNCPSGCTNKARFETLECAGAACTSTECCDCTCTTHFTAKGCQSGYRLKTMLPDCTIAFPGRSAETLADTCSQTLCCEATCLQPAHVCPDHMQKKATALTIPCVQGSTCTTELCCDGVCGSSWKTGGAEHTCAATVGLKNKEDKVDRMCTGKLCTDTDCCDHYTCKDANLCTPKCTSKAGVADTQCRAIPTTGTVTNPLEYCSTPRCCDCSCTTHPNTCVSNYIPKEAAATTICYGTDAKFAPGTMGTVTCTNAACCDRTCQHDDFTCPQGHTKKATAPTVRCDTAPACDATLCCDGVCSQVVCARSEGRQNKFASNVAQSAIKCASDCTVGDCCVDLTCTTANPCISARSVMKTTANVTACAKDCTEATCCETKSDIACQTDAECRALGDPIATCSGALSLNKVCVCSPGYKRFPSVTGTQYELCVPTGTTEAEARSLKVRYSFSLYFKNGRFDLLTDGQKQDLIQAVRTYYNAPIKVSLTAGSIVAAGNGEQSYPFPTPAGLTAAVASVTPSSVFGTSVEAGISSDTKACVSAVPGATETVAVSTASGSLTCVVLACDTTRFVWDGSVGTGVCTPLAVVQSSDDDKTATIAVATIGGVLGCAAIVALVFLFMRSGSRKSAGVPADDTEPAKEAA